MRSEDIIIQLIKHNYMKPLRRIAALFLSCLLCCSCNETGLIISGIMVLILSVTLLMALDNNRNKKEMEREAVEAARREIEQYNREANALKAAYLEKEDALKARYGTPDKVITLEQYDIDKEIRVYNEVKKVVIYALEFSYCDILECNISDDSRVKKGETTIVSSGNVKTDSSSMVGRALVGGLVGGVAGSVIGGVTAKQNTTTTSVVSHGDDVLYHDYTVWISVRNIATPSIRINVGANQALANEIYSLMTTIIASK